jgi:hypothetical protein
MLGDIPREIMTIIVDSDPRRSQKVCLVCKSLAVHKDEAVNAANMRKSEQLVKCYEDLIKVTKVLIQQLRDELYEKRIQYAVKIGAELFELLQSMMAGIAPTSRIGIHSHIHHDGDSAEFELEEMHPDGKIQRAQVEAFVFTDPVKRIVELCVNFKSDAGRKMLATILADDIVIDCDENRCELRITPETPTTGEMVLKIGFFPNTSRDAVRSTRYHCGWFIAARALGSMQ